MTNDCPEKLKEDVEVLMQQKRVVEVKSDKEYNVYLKEYDESFSGISLNAEIKQVHPRKRNDSPFAVRLLMNINKETYDT